VSESLSTAEYQAFVERMWIGGEGERLERLIIGLKRGSALCPDKRIGEMMQDASVALSRLTQLRDLFIMATGLGGEAGEVLEKLKKWIRDGNFDRDDVKKELGDLLYYVTKTAGRCGLTLDEVMAGNVAKLESRAARGTTQGSGDNR
jgi:NTP pyrophosphatase (non-canonical NTP hydrolase)